MVLARRRGLGPALVTHTLAFPPVSTILEQLCRNELQSTKTFRSFSDALIWSHVTFMYT